MKVLWKTIKCHTDVSYYSFPYCLIAFLGFLCF